MRLPKWNRGEVLKEHRKGCAGEFWKWSYRAVITCSALLMLTLVALAIPATRPYAAKIIACLPIGGAKEWFDPAPVHTPPRPTPVDGPPPTPPVVPRKTKPVLSVDFSQSSPFLADRLNLKEPILLDVRAPQAIADLGVSIEKPHPGSKDCGPYIESNSEGQFFLKFRNMPSPGLLDLGFTARVGGISTGCTKQITVSEDFTIGDLRAIREGGAEKGFGVTDEDFAPLDSGERFEWPNNYTAIVNPCIYFWLEVSDNTKFEASLPCGIYFRIDFPARSIQAIQNGEQLRTVESFPTISRKRVKFKRVVFFVTTDQKDVIIGIRMFDSDKKKNVPRILARFRKLPGATYTSDWVFHNVADTAMAGISIETYPKDLENAQPLPSERPLRP